MAVSPAQEAHSPIEGEHRPHRLMKLTCLFFVVLLLLCSCYSFSQVRKTPPDPRDRIISRLVLHRATIRHALKIVLKGQRYKVSKKVQGRVTVKLYKVAAEEALRKLLDQVNATYRFSGGAYEIIPRVIDIGFLIIKD